MSSRGGCPPWCTEHRQIEFAGERCLLHRGVVYRRAGTAGSDVTALELAVGQSVGEIHGVFDARAALRVWDSPWGAAMGPDELRELAAAALAAADAMKAAGGEPWPDNVIPLRVDSPIDAPTV